VVCHILIVIVDLIPIICSNNVTTVRYLKKLRYMFVVSMFVILYQSTSFERELCLFYLVIQFVYDLSKLFSNTYYNFEK
jgi:hypothetical protein